MTNKGGRDDAPEDDGEDSADRPTRSVPLSLDATLELLANYDRRCILEYLMESQHGTATVDELVEHLLEKQAERTGERPAYDHVLTTLHHIHVPKLVDAGVVEYDARSQEIRYWSNDRLEKWHRRIRDDES